LLAFSRRRPAQSRAFALGDVVGGMETMLRRLIGSEVDLLIIRGPDPVTVVADPAQIEQVVLNLVINARDAMPEGGTLTIATANHHVTAAEAPAQAGLSPGNYALLTVSDTGPGIPASVRPHIFEPFFTTKEQGKGTGLGLATVYGIVKQSGGGIYLEEGEGASFAIYLPALNAGAGDRAASARD
jgi:signal transduction histidine kinase